MGGLENGINRIADKKYANDRGPKKDYKRIWNKKDRNRFINTNKYADLYEVCYRLLESLND